MNKIYHRNISIFYKEYNKYNLKEKEEKNEIQF